MFETPQSRYFLRAAVATVLGFLGALQVAIFDSSISGPEWVGIATATVTVLGGYLGLGQVSSNMEPFVGSMKHDSPAKVPTPPADPVHPEEV